MAVVILFWIFLLSACLLVARLGGTTERGFLAFMVACSGLTLALSPKLGFVDSEHALFALDLTILVVILAIAQRSRAYWPIWFAAFQLIIVATGFTRLIFPDAVTSHYLLAAGFWALPEVLVLVLGTLADHRMRAAARAQA